MNNRKHYAAAITAFVVWGFFSIPLRALKDYSAGEILYFRILLSLVLLAVLIVSFKRKEIQENRVKLQALDSKSKRTIITLCLAGGLLLTVNWLTFIYIVNNVNVKTASFSYLICPVITAVLGYVLIKEKMTTLQWIAVVLCAFSCVLIGISSALELGYSFLTAFTYALYLITQRKVQGFDRLILLGIQVLFATIVLTFFSGLLVNEVPTSFRFYAIILSIATFFTVIPLFLNLFALNKINSATIGILMYLNPLINFTIAFIVFKESINSIQLVGYAIIAVALVVFNYQNFGKLRKAAVAQR
ncbi:MAG TPA: EamA family transporter [Chryseosolibacter sp.]